MTNTKKPYRSLFTGYLNFLIFFLYISKVQTWRQLMERKETSKTYLGVLTQHNMFNSQNDINKNFEYSEIPYDLVSYVLQTGVELVYIPYDMPFEDQKDLLANTNGLVFPGGASRLIEHPIEGGLLTDYMQKVKQIIDWAIFRNKVQKKYFSIFGVCLGYEQLFIALADGDPKVLSHG
jgi:gamma-glutamyl-gamma-aminobutyrate hydrolase PuuD